MKFVHMNESIMCRYEQEQVQKCTTRSRKIHDDEKFKIAKTKYNFNAYQKVLRAVYIRHKRC